MSLIVTTPRAKRRYTSQLNFALVVGITGAIVLPAMAAAAGDDLNIDRRAASVERPENVPAWQPSYSERFPGCSPKKSATPVDLVVVDMRSAASRMDFDTAWTRTHNPECADDVWVVGWC